MVRGEATIRQLIVTQVLASGVKHPGKGFKPLKFGIVVFPGPGAKKTLSMQFQMYWGMSRITSGMR
ncbi:MAG: hypothetical protein Ct9H300mP19_09450 [Dehalococcoidia bacterium]|nr:MAG: hypothetical protein Ct9H300mP19_09450 [Dehalococcoidia bacterium]